MLHGIGPTVEIGGVTLTVLGPGQNEVDDLEEKWAEDVEKIVAKRAHSCCSPR